MQADRGKALFTSVGCAGCHTPDIGGVTGVYSDFMLHRLEDRESKYGRGPTPEVPLPSDPPLARRVEDAPPLGEWPTPPLTSTTAARRPCTPRSSATRARPPHHRGVPGLSSDDQAALLAFLDTLKAPADARPAATRSRADVALAR
jgi:hypothetical protein